MIARSNKTAGARMNPLMQFFFYNFPALTTLLARPPWIYRYGILTSIFRFVFKHGNKCSPRGIAYMFIQIILSIFHHSFHVKIFVSNQIEAVNQELRCLMLKVPTLIGNLSVKIHQFAFLWLSPLLGIFALHLLQFRLRLFKVLRIGYLLSIRKNSKCCESNINTDCLPNDDFFFDCRWDIARKDTVPTSPLFLYGAGFNFRSNRDIPMHG